MFFVRVLKRAMKKAYQVFLALAEYPKGCEAAQKEDSRLCPFLLCQNALNTNGDASPFVKMHRRHEQ